YGLQRGHGGLHRRRVERLLGPAGPLAGAPGRHPGGGIGRARGLADLRSGGADLAGREAARWRGADGRRGATACLSDEGRNGCPVDDEGSTDEGRTPLCERWEPCFWPWRW